MTDAAGGKSAGAAGSSATFALVGPGRAGLALARALTAADWPMVSLAGREPSSASVQAAAREFGAAVTVLGQVGKGAELVLLAVPDSAIEACATAIADSLETSALVVHCSGATDLSVFDALRSVRPDVRVGSIHPLQTLPGRPTDSTRLIGAGFAVEGPVDALNQIVAQIGGVPFTVADRVLYHAAAVVASNHLVALIGQLQRLSDLSGAPLEAFRPLAEHALANAFDLGPQTALTGPVARGDAATVMRHLRTLPPEEQAGYRALALEALKLVTSPDPAIRSLLEEPSGTAQSETSP